MVDHETFLCVGLFRAIVLGSNLLSEISAEQTRPNILLIVADDLCRRDLGYEGNAEVRTPHLDQLCKESMHFQRMFNPATSCSPTRHALYTGLFPIRSGAYPNHTRVYDGTESLFTLLKANGYRVALQNKSHVGPSDSFPFEPISGGDDYSETKKFLMRDPTQPWFLVFGSNDPHEPWDRGIEYDPKQIQVPSYLHDNATTRDCLARYYGEISKLDEQVGNLLQLLKETEQSSRTIVIFVSEQGSSMPYGGKWSLYDNGIHSSTLIRWPGKVVPGTKSTALVQYVDIAPTLLEAIGMAPDRIDTKCPDADGKRGFDGKSFLNVLMQRTEQHRKYVFAQHTTLGTIGAQSPYPMRSVRSDRYKLILNLAPENTYSITGIHESELLASWKEDAKSDSKLAARIEWLYHRPSEELYDLENDPFEMTNLANDKRYISIKEGLLSELLEWMRQQKDQGLPTEKLFKERQGKSEFDKAKAQQKRVNP